jgi:hypothetical protein
VTAWFLSTKFHVRIETCLIGNGETSKANIVGVKERKRVCFVGPVLETECFYPLTTQRNPDARKYPALRALV